MTKRERIEEVVNFVLERSQMTLPPSQFAARLQEELEKNLDFSVEVKDLTTPELEDHGKAAGTITYQADEEWRVIHYNVA